MNLFKACYEKKSFSMEEEFPQEVLGLLQRRDNHLKIDGVVLFEELGFLAAEIRQMQMDTSDYEINYQDYVDTYLKYVFALSLVSKYLYPVIEQLDTMIDKKIKIIPRKKTKKSL